MVFSPQPMKKAPGRTRGGVARGVWMFAVSSEPLPEGGQGGPAEQKDLRGLGGGGLLAQGDLRPQVVVVGGLVGVGVGVAPVYGGGSGIIIV